MGADAGCVAPGCRQDASPQPHRQRGECPTPAPSRIVSVATASIGETGFPLDSHGEAIYDGLAWFDIRTEPQAQQIAELDRR